MYDLAQALEWAISAARAASSLPQPFPATEPVAHLLYCSKARHPFSEDELADLLELTRTTNERLDITGLLCYSEGHFVQMLEGPRPAVERLYDRIEQDPRHYRLQVICQGAGTLRRFPDWRVALANAPHDCYWLIPCFEARVHHLLKPQIPVIESTLSALLNTFGRMCTPPQSSGGMLGAAHWAARPILAAV